MSHPTAVSTIPRGPELLGQTVVVIGGTFDIDGGQQLVEG